MTNDGREIDNNNNGQNGKPTLGSMLGLFFIAVGAGAIFISLGVISLIKLSRGQPALLSYGLAIAAIIVGLVIDVAAVLRIYSQRKQLLEHLNRQD